MSSRFARWLVTPRPVEHPRARVVCFPHGGSGGWQFRAWVADVPDDVEVVAAHLPGRDDRMDEPPLFDMASVVRELTPRIAPLLDVPTVFYGLSCGARVAAAVISKLTAESGPLPRRLVAACCHPPHVSGPLVRPLRNLSDRDLIRELKSLSGAPQAFFALPELVAAMLPALKADTSIAETMVFDPTLPLPVEIVAIHARDDHHTSPAAMRRWGELTSKEFTFLEIDGGHFFPIQSRTGEWFDAIRGVVSG